jgi:hypothetical protein
MITKKEIKNIITKARKGKKNIKITFVNDVSCVYEYIGQEENDIDISLSSKELSEQLFEHINFIKNIETV